MSYRLKLKEMRKESGLTQKEVAAKAGVKLSTYRTWEQGTSGISFEKAYALAIVLGCSVNDLCGWPKGKNEGRVFEDDLRASRYKLRTRAHTARARACRSFGNTATMPRQGAT